MIEEVRKYLEKSTDNPQGRPKKLNADQREILDKLEKTWRNTQNSGSSSSSKTRSDAVAETAGSTSTTT